MRCSGENSSPNISWKASMPSAGLREKSAMPKKLGRGMPEMPLGPPVNWYQLTRMMRMISPKPSVTMAK